ncbi:MAG: hypothetical protein CV088_12565 [Nitrospira sp. LK70]|nr:hypothetical protein [Nitrospira sp. LK70]
MLQARLSQWTVTMCVAGIGLAAVLLVPNEGYTDSGPGGTWFLHGEQKKDFASRTFRALLHHPTDFTLSAEQVGRLEVLAADYARTRIRNRAAAELAEVDVKALIKNPQSELSAIEAALRKSETATTTERLDRVKAIRSALAVLTPDQREGWKAKMRDRHHDQRQGSTCGNVTGRHERVHNLDDTAVTSVSQESALLADNEPMGTTQSEMSVDLSELP